MGALAQLLGWIDVLTLRRALIFAVFAIFPLLLAHEGLRTIARLNGKPLTGFARYGVFALFLFSPLLWQGMLGYGHIELAIMLWLLLLGVNALADGRAGWAGVFLGLALLTRSSALVYVIPLLGVTLWRRRWSQAARFVDSTPSSSSRGWPRSCWPTARTRSSRSSTSVASCRWAATRSGVC